MRRFLATLAATTFLTGAAAAATIYPIDRATILVGSPFDFKVEFSGVVKADDVKVTVNGKDYKTVFGKDPVFTEKEEKNLIVIKATIHTERESHKPILIGKKGAMLKEVGQRARQELEALLGCKIFLELFIRVDQGWTQNPYALTEMGL